MNSETIAIEIVIAAAIDLSSRPAFLKSVKAAAGTPHTTARFLSHVVNPSASNS